MVDKKVLTLEMGAITGLGMLMLMNLEHEW